MKNTCEKYVTPTGKRLHVGYVQKAEARKKHTIWYHSSQQTTHACGSMV